VDGIHVKKLLIHIATPTIGLVGEIAVMKMDAAVFRGVNAPARSVDFGVLEGFAISIAHLHAHYISGKIAELIATRAPVWQPHIGICCAGSGERW
jgi:hypothetical protein